MEKCSVNASGTSDGVGNISDEVCLPGSSRVIFVFIK